MSDAPQPHQPPHPVQPPPAEIVEEPPPDWDDDPDEDVGEWPPPPARSRNTPQLVTHRGSPMAAFVRRIFVFIACWLRPQQALPAAPAANTDGPPPPPDEHTPNGGSEPSGRPAPPPTPQAQRRQPRPLASFKTRILDELPGYFWALKQLRKADANTYEFFRKVGARVLQGDLKANCEVVEDLFLANMPALGAVALCTDRDGSRGPDRHLPFEDRKIGMRFLYFRKLSKAPWNVQKSPPGTQIYAITGVYAFDRHGKNRDFRAVIQTYAAVHTDGTISILKNMQLVAQRIGDATIFRRAWWFSNWDNGVFSAMKLSPQQYATELTAWALNFFANSQTEMVNVRAISANDNLAAAFSVGVLDAKDFFRDRQLATVNGRRKPIFHIVRTHSRVTPSGKVVPVKVHFSGEREFEWNGYRIKLSVPGWHHADLLEFDVPSQFERTGDDLAETFIDGDELQARLAAHVTETGYSDRMEIVRDLPQIPPAAACSLPPSLRDAA